VCPIAPVISHLCFANNTLIFYNADITQANVVKTLLHDYERASGQCVNYNKTDVVFSKGVGEERRNAITLALDIRDVLLHDK